LRDDREGITAQFTGRTGTAPQARFYPSGELVWEFTVRVVDTWDTTGHVETVTVRAPDQNYGSLQNWVKPGALLLIRGWLRLVRWHTAEGKDKARMVVDCIELTPLGVRVPGSAPGAMDYRGRVTAPPAGGFSDAIARDVAADAVSKQARAARARQLLDEALAP
jgi:single-stranded DNA-binding protein